MGTVHLLAVSARAGGGNPAAMDDWGRSLRAAGKSEATVYAYTYWPRRLHRDCGDHPTPADVDRWLASHDWAPATRDRVVRSLRLWFRHSGRDHLADRLPHVKVPARRAPVCPEPVYRDALAAADPTTRLALRLIRTTGLRRAEAAAVHSDHLAGGLLRVEGKGGRVRYVPVPPDVAQAVADAQGWLFPTRGGHITAARLGVRIKAALGIPAHSLRRMYATGLYRATGDLVAVQELLGHASLMTTQRYLGMDADRLAAVAAHAWAA